MVFQSLVLTLLVTSEFTSIDTSGNIKFIVSGSDSIGVVVKYQKQPTDVTRGDFEDTSTSGSVIS